MSSSLELGFEFRNQRFRDAAKGLEALAREVGRGPEVVTPALRSELRSFMRAVQTALRQRHSTPWRPGGSPPDRLFRRTGSGIEGIRDQVLGRNIETLRGVLTVPFPLSVHERGATIRARRVRFLTIPLEAALDSRGVPIRPRARDWPNTFVQRSRRGNLLIFQRRGGGIVPLYLLKREVRLPARLGVQDTFRAGTDFFVDQAIERMARALTT